MPQCSALVLIHEDVEIADDNFRAKALHAVRNPAVGIAGVVGAAGLRDLEWWTGRRRAGFVYETRGPLDFGDRRASVDALDGLLLIVSPSAFRTILFDEETFPAFHGYDIDYCLQARQLGLQVVVAPIDVFHRTEPMRGDREAFEVARMALAAKWPGAVRRSKPRELVVPAVRRRVNTARRAQHRIQVQGRERVQQLLSPRAVWTRRGHDSTGPQSPADKTIFAERSQVHPVGCPVCGTRVAPVESSANAKSIAACPKCGTGITFPPPHGDITSARVFEGLYAGKRLAMRSTWYSEARMRLAWLKLYVPDGLLLEIGCATGEFVSEATKEGYEAYGVEVSAWAAQQARALGGDIVTGLIEDWMVQYPDLRADAILMWHVLEHVAEPIEFLSKARTALHPTGRLVVEVPNYAATVAQSEGSDWTAAALDDHYYHYRPEGLRSILEGAGLTVVSMLEFSGRAYSTVDGWRRLRNQALLQRATWPSLDYVRAIAVPSS